MHTVITLNEQTSISCTVVYVKAPVPQVSGPALRWVPGRMHSCPGRMGSSFTSRLCRGQPGCRPAPSKCFLRSADQSQAGLTACFVLLKKSNRAARSKHNAPEQLDQHFSKSTVTLPLLCQSAHVLTSCVMHLRQDFYCYLTCRVSLFCLLAHPLDVRVTAPPFYPKNSRYSVITSKGAQNPDSELLNLYQDQGSKQHLPCQIYKQKSKFLIFTK